MNLRFIPVSCITAVLLGGCAHSTSTGTIGIDRQQLLIVPAEALAKEADLAFSKLQTDETRAGKLITSGPEYARLDAIAKRIIKQTSVYRADALSWAWQLALIDRDVVNAFVMPNGKITFYTGIIRKLKLTDDEIAAIMGHEVAHALREHSREKASQKLTSDVLLSVAASTSKKADSVSALGGLVSNGLFLLPNSRNMEAESDIMGIELAARAGYDPRAAISVWKKMIALESGSSATPAFLSTHPTHEDRIANLETKMALAMPLYEEGQRQMAAGRAMQKSATPTAAASGLTTSPRSRSPKARSKTTNKPTGTGKSPAAQ